MIQKAVQALLVLSLLGFLSWVAVRLTKPIFGISQDGFFLLTLMFLIFAIALSLYELAFIAKK
jgi:hypothetical protein